MSERLYEYRWGNNPKRAQMVGRICRITNRRRMALNSCAIEFLDNGQKEIVSRNALKKVKK